MCQSMYINMYRLSDNFTSFLDVVSTHSVSKRPNLNSGLGLVSTFINQNFIMYRHSIGSSRVRACAL